MTNIIVALGFLALMAWGMYELYNGDLNDNDKYN